MRVCISSLDSATTEATAAALALGELAACVRSQACREFLADDRKAIAPKAKALVQKLADSAVAMCLKQPLADVAAAGRQLATRNMSVAWARYATILLHRHGLDQSGLIDVVSQAVGVLDAALGNIGRSRRDVPEFAELYHGQECLVAFLQAAVVGELTEGGARKLLEALTALVSAPASSPAVVGFGCQAINLVVRKLGELDEECAAEVEAALMGRVVAGSAAIRQHAAAAVASLALARPSCTTRLLLLCLGRVEEAAEKLDEAEAAEAAAYASEASSRSATAAANGAAQAQPPPPSLLLEGYSAVASGLLQASTHMPLGIPSKLCDDCYSLARSLLLTPGCSSTKARGHAREAGYVLLSAVCRSMHPDTMRERMNEIFGDLLSEQVMFPDKTPAAADGGGAGAAVGGGGEKKPLPAPPRPISRLAKASASGEVAAQLRGFAAGLQAAASFLAVVLGREARTDIMQTVGHLLSRALQEMQDQTAAAAASPPVLPTVLSSLMAVQLRLLQACLALPDTAAILTMLPRLTKLCSAALGAQPPGAKAGPTTAEVVSAPQLTAMLQTYLCHEDDVLDADLARSSGEAAAPGAGAGVAQDGYWPSPLSHIAGAGHLGKEASHNTASSSSSSARLHGVRAGSASLVATSLGGSGAAGRAQDSFFFALTSDQQYSVLAEAQLLLIGKAIAVSTPYEQIRILDAMQSALDAKLDPKAIKLPGALTAASATATAICVALLSTLGPQTKGAKEHEETEASRTIADRMIALTAGMAPLMPAPPEDPAAHATAMAVTRAAAEVSGVAASMGGSTYAIKHLKRLCAEAALAVDKNYFPETRCFLALSLASVHRYAGGITLQALMPPTVDALVAIASRPVGKAHIWAVHALWAVASNVGLSYLPHVAKSLTLALELLLSSAGEDSSLKPACARLANAMVVSK